jgi:hypothetical protein
MKKLIFSLLGLGLVLLIGACGNDEKATTNTEKLTTGQWKLTAWTSSFTFNGVLQPVDSYAQLGSCQKDDFIEFKTDGSCVKDEGPTTCGGPQQVTGTWAFSDSETHIVISGLGFYDIDADILELTDTKLRVSYEVNLGGTITTNEMVIEKI